MHSLPKHPDYKNFRLTVNNPLLVSAIEELQNDTGMSEKEIAQEALYQFLSRQNLIEVE